MRILALETSTYFGGVAFVSGDACETTGPFAPRESSREVLAAAHDLLARHGCGPADLDLIAVTTGPGLFTGVRIGLSIAKALIWGQGPRGPTTLVGVPTLQAVASLALVERERRAQEGDLVIAAIDARRGEAYAALFRVGPALPLCRLCEDIVVRPERLLARLEEASKGEKIDVSRLWLAGDAMDHYHDPIAAQFREPVRTVAPRPGALAPQVAELGRARFLAGQAETPEALRPRYVRRPDARLPTLRLPSL